MEPGKYQTWRLVQYIIGIRTETSQRINATHSSRGIYYLFTVFIFNCVCVCKRQSMSKNSDTCPLLQDSGSIFDVFFSLLIKKLLLGSKTMWQSMRKFPCKNIFSYGQRKNFFYLKTAYWYRLIFLDNYLFIRLENLKASL